MEVTVKVRAYEASGANSEMMLPIKLALLRRRSKI